MEVYKDERSKIIYEFLKQFDEETNERKKFSSALKSKLLQAHYNEEEIKMLKDKIKELEEEERE